ncbi:FtsX-like permease family protein [Haliea sp.]|uniref:ABC transporter permease n=1 Tax=Haliea sp. TaxID=1932666 RepID=UPI0025BA3CDA|nr:FtsX-like permease family protein [Haliea sp.]
MTESPVSTAGARLWTAWVLALQFLRDGRGQTVTIMVGVAVGVAVVVFVSALIQGLQSNIVQRTLGTQAHIRVLAPDEVNQRPAFAEDTLQLVWEDRRAQRRRSINNWQQVVATLDTLSSVGAVSPVIAGPAFAGRGAALESVALTGIDLQRYQQIIPLADYITGGSVRLEPGEAMIGSELAATLGLSVGDKLRLDTGRDNPAVVNVVAVFELGVRELDARNVYLGLKQAQALLGLPGGVTQLDLVVEDIFAADTIARRIARLTGLEAESWMEKNAQLMNALSAQSLSTNMIIVFVSLSVAFGIASVLSVSVVQRTREIGILRAMGAGRQQVLQVFLIQGALYGLLGALMGIAGAYVLVWVFNTFGPGLFFIPVAGGLVVFALVLATVVGVLAAAVPSRRAAMLDPVVAIRYV